MASVGLTEAARLVRRNQSTIHRAMQTGRLSYSTDSAGKRVVDTAELDRVFGVQTPTSPDPVKLNGASLDGHAHAAKSQSAHVGDMHIARGEHAALHQLLADREACIADLRGRLDASEAERRQLSERLHGLLTAKRDVDRGDKTVRRHSENAEREPANASENNMIDTSVSAIAEPAADPY